MLLLMFHSYHSLLPSPFSLFHLLFRFFIIVVAIVIVDVVNDNNSQ